MNAETSSNSNSPSRFVRWFILNVREPVNGYTHALGAVLSLFGMIWLVWLARELPGRAIALAIFGTTMVLLYTASSVMHLYKGDAKIEKTLNIIDHAAIYLLIAGSYTPFCYAFLDGWWRVGMLTTIWTVALIGVTLKLGFNMYGHVSTAFYVLMGWIAAIIIPKMLMSGYVSAMGMLALGGIIYTIGAVIYALEKPNFHKYFGYHELWHLFVLGGSACHFIAAAIWVAYPATLIH
jgi:hemolysin III